MSSEDSSDEIYYQCQRCANCCRWPGEVVLTEEDTTRIAAFLELSLYDFVQRHTALRLNRQGLTLLAREDGSCEFLDGIDCRIQTVKPEQCRGFPNEWTFPGWRELCEAIEVRRSRSVQETSRSDLVSDPEPE
jgi:Fe-S-cluster containining protein